MPAVDVNDGHHIILVHGGTITDPGRVLDAQLGVIREAVTAGNQRLAGGTAALDVVVETITVMENTGLFDAGKGSYLNREGYVENDASLADGRTGRAGAVALLRCLKNPIMAARIVMERTGHVMLAGAAAEQTLINLGAEAVADVENYFKPVNRMYDRESGMTGTVGAVVLDRHGQLAAGTSTGGTRGKLAGRISDSAIIGAGTYANRDYAVSATGLGEYFIRRSAACDIALRAGYLGLSLQQAADKMIHDLIGGADKAPGGVIAISRRGEIALSCNAYGMLHGYASDQAGVTAGFMLSRP
jgi:isoaspartyl peptidase/L-asparaginase-like protein (Ntn-hydrolase superfamily)